MEVLKKFGKEFVLYIIVVAVFWGLGYSLIKLFGIEIPANNREPLMLIIGFLIAKAGTVVDYFFGSSKGSSEKNDLLKKGD